jgi:hypothetical protein
MKTEEIGIAILDVYTESDLQNCYNCVSTFENVLVISNTKNKVPTSNFRRYDGCIPFATMRNYALSNFRILGLKHLFLINSNQIIKNKNVFQDIIKTAEVFGTWCMTGPAEKTISIEDDKKNLSLDISNKLNSEFLYIYTGIVSNIGYFDERFFNTKELDVIDYVTRMREKKVYPPINYNPTYNADIESSNSVLQKNGHKEMDNADQSVNMSYAYFLHKHQYIPTQNDPKPVTNEQLMSSLEEIQKNYSKNEN